MPNKTKTSTAPVLVGYPLLQTIQSPMDLRQLERTQLGQLANELRAYVLESVSKTCPTARPRAASDVVLSCSCWRSL